MSIDQQNRELDQALAAHATPHESPALREMWELAGTVSPAPSLSDGAARVMRRAVLARASSRRNTILWVGAAAAVLILLTVGVFGIRPSVHVAAPGLPMTVYLDDGSEVRLRAGSTLWTPGWLRAGRRVRLVGEAHFAVASAPDVFTVSTEAGEIRVLGTEFSVRSWPAEGHALIHLHKGSIQVAARSGGAKRVLKPGQAVRMTATELEADALRYPADAALSWISGDLTFIGADLQQIADDLGRRFGVGIQLHPDLDRNRKVTLAIRDPSGADSVLHDLTLALGLAYRPISGGWQIIHPER